MTTATNERAVAELIRTIAASGLDGNVIAGAAVAVLVADCVAGHGPSAGACRMSSTHCFRQWVDVCWRKLAPSLEIEAKELAELREPPPTQSEVLQHLLANYVRRMEASAQSRDVLEKMGLATERA